MGALIIVARRKILIITLACTAMVVTFLVLLLVPNRFAATASFVPSQQETSELAMLQNQTFSALGLGSKQTYPFSDILSSRSIADSIIERFGLHQAYDLELRRDVRKLLKKRTTVETSLDGTVSVTVIDENPETSAAIANAYVEYLAKTLARFDVTAAGRKRQFLETRLAEARESLARATDSLAAFQERNRLVSISNQIESNVGAVAELYRALAQERIEYETKALQLAPNSMPLRQSQRRMEAISQEINQLWQGAATRSAMPYIIDRESGASIPLSEVPEIAKAWGRIYREVKVQEMVFELVAQQYELARIAEARDALKIQVLDFAEPPEKKVWPPRVLMTLFAGLVAFIIGVAFCFLQEFRARIAEDGRTANTWARLGRILAWWPKPGEWVRNPAAVAPDEQEDRAP